MPLPLLHVDTGHNFPEMIFYQDRLVAELGLRLHVAAVQDWIDDGRLTERPGGTGTRVFYIEVDRRMNTTSFIQNTSKMRN